MDAGIAAVVVLANTVASKLYMSLAFRARLLSASSSEERKEILESIAFKNASSAQLNEAEYSPLFFAGLCFLKLRQRNCPLTALLGAVSGPTYMWGRVCIGRQGAVVGSLLRYTGLLLLLWNIYLAV
ncbi:unnamed protein product [Symbiodinium natans]|uniref:Uncharacterized protein n=1 Tax=Symbiodinium natans TaxID=878477 RepID=A0A812SRF7_9DINO|nr:unnamed protein product [Symbiodinium natans]